MIAACDTFRSGAVEQLKTHCARLNVPLYERGYEKDPAKVAFEATKAAARSKIDVLLVDTAGGAQHEPFWVHLLRLLQGACRARSMEDECTVHVTLQFLQPGGCGTGAGIAHLTLLQAGSSPCLHFGC